MFHNLGLWCTYTLRHSMTYQDSSHKSDLECSWQQVEDESNEDKLDGPSSTINSFADGTSSPVQVVSQIQCQNVTKNSDANFPDRGVSSPSEYGVSQFI